MKKFGNLLWGIVFIIVGIIWGINSLGIASINVFFNGWWTLFIIIPCFIGIFKEREKMGNFIGLVIGIILLLCCRGILSFNMILKLALPLILVFIGINIIFKDFISGKINQRIKELNTDGMEEYCGTFSEQKVTLRDNEFKNAKLDAVFGSVKFDFSNCNISEDGVIKTSAIFGGITIIVPSNVNIKIKSTSIFGGVSNKIERVRDNKLPTIYVDALCLFGGVDIR
ncbi:MAG: LiaF-related protein [Clostridia bacterium]|nr:LiaF-related protein [Clostridia bacterium]